MKKILTTALLLSALYAHAQESKLTRRDYWQSKPDLATVKADLNGYAFSGTTKGDDPLSLAISNDAPTEVIAFLAGQPGVDQKKDVHEGRTYLHSAASKGNPDAVDVLLKKGADMYYLDAHEQTALTYAGFMGSLTLPVLKTFVQHGLDVKKKYSTKNNADVLLLAIGSDKDFSITDYLLAKGLSLKTTDKVGASAITYAARQGNVSAIKTLVSKGVKPTDKDLLSAAQGPFRSANKIDIFQYLVDDLKLNPMATNEEGQNVLHIVGAKANQDDIITYFVSKGVDVNLTDKNGNTPFMTVCNGKSLPVVTLMLPSVKNINAVNSKGETALSNAVKGSTGEVVTLLLSKGANAGVKDKEGNSLAYYLVDGYQGAGGRGGFGGGPGGGGGAGGPGGGRGGNPNGGGDRPRPQEDFAKKLAALREKGIDLAAPQKDGNTLYHLAVAKGDLGMIKQLDGLNIDVNAKNKEGMTALHKAALIAKDDAILKYLISAGAKKDAVTSVDETAFDLAKENEFLSKNNVSVDFLK